MKGSDRRNAVTLLDDMFKNVDGDQDSMIGVK